MNNNLDNNTPQNLDDWFSLLRKQPKFVEKCDRLNEFDLVTWLLLVENPIIRQKAKNYEIGRNAILQIYPKFADECNDWDFSVNLWRSLLEVQPKFASKAKEFENGRIALGNVDIPKAWRHHLTLEPDNANMCNCWDQFSASGWVSPILKQPQFEDKAKECVSGWVGLLRLDPKEAYKCNKFEEFTADDWKWLLKRQPQLRDIAKKHGYNVDKI